MAETPKKIIDSEYKCFLCDAFTHSSRVNIFGKSGLDIPRLIESAVGENWKNMRTLDPKCSFALNATKDSCDLKKPRRI